MIKSSLSKGVRDVAKCMNFGSNSVPMLTFYVGSMIIGDLSSSCSGRVSNLSSFGAIVGFSP